MRNLYTLNYFACLLFASSMHPGSASAASSVKPIASGTPSADSTFKGWYYTPTGAFGRLPLDNPKSRHFVKIAHPSPDLAVVQRINPAGITVNTTQIYFSAGLIALLTETDRWGDTYDSVRFKPDGPDKFLVTAGFSSCYVSHPYGAHWVPGHWGPGYYHEHWVPGHWA